MLIAAMLGFVKATAMLMQWLRSILLFLRFLWNGCWVLEADGGYGVICLFC